MKKLSATFILAILAISLFSQTNQNPWKDVAESSFAKKAAMRRIVPAKYRSLSLDLGLLKSRLSEAPMRFTPEAENSTVTLAIPMPDGTMEEFQMVDAPIMQPELAARYPYIHSYAGWSNADHTAYLRCGYTQKGFHAMVLSANHSTVYIDAFAEGDDEHYISYYKKDFANPHTDFECLVDAPPSMAPIVSDGQSLVGGDCQHRNYALALACTGEYATFHGGTKPLVMAEFNVAMTRVNGIYEKDLAVTMTMVNNTDLLIYLNGSTDPYTNNNGSTMLNENQNNCNNVIGNANYDIGHVFSTGGGGIAQLNAVCNNSGKARGVTGLGSPVGDGFYVDYVAHEMGHQFGGNHTQNNDCNRNSSTAMETGSGSTIMGYAGVCAPDVQPHSDDYFHGISLDEIYDHILGAGNSCATTTPSGNSAPTVTVAQSNFSLPISTPFVLTAQGQDANSADVLTYCWEQMNNQVGTQPPLSTNTVGPVFRSFTPTTSPKRYFPRLADLVNGVTPTWEVLPSVARTMLFRCTVRDNHPGAGCTDEVNTTLSFVASAGPFVVTNPNTAAVVWTSNSTATVAWNVANTTAPPISTSQVEILLSTDGGLTYPYTLAASTSNDGTEMVLVPNVTTTQARVMVKALNNVYFDISNANFKIQAPVVPSFTLVTNNNTSAACQDGTAEFSFEMLQLAGFNTPVVFSATGVPAGATTTFTPNNTAPPADVILTIGNLTNVTPGTYPITVTATGGTVTQTSNLTLSLLDVVTSNATLSAPADGAEVTSFTPTLTWSAVANASQYYVEVSESPAFSSIFSSSTVATNSWQMNLPGTANDVYYWRVRAQNPCSQSGFSTAFAFHIGGVGCQTFNATGLPLTIPTTATTVTKTLNVPVGMSIVSVKTDMNIAHTWIGDLGATLNSPQGTTMQVFDRPGVPASDFGCDRDNIVASFADSYANSATVFENTCNTTTPAISGNFQPIEPFSGFAGENSQGTWTLSITDSYDDDGGSLNAWSVEICGPMASSPAIMATNDVLTVPQGLSGTITDSYLQGQGTPPAQTVYTLLSLPAHGNLMVGIDVPVVGSTFTQADIDAGLLVYDNDGSSNLTDQFVFDMQNPAGNWLHAQVFHINIIPNNLAATAAITQGISCAGANNGQITVTATGGNAPLQFSLNGGAFQGSNVFSNLAPGSYTIEVKDNVGFIVSTSTISLAAPSAIVVTSSVNVDQITVTASGGTGGLQYSIGGAFQGSNVFSGLANGAYTVTVSDANGCTATTTALVAVNTVVANASISHAITCFGANNGEITASAAGGNPPYQYSLNGGAYQSSSLFTNLAPGTYTITVKDADDFTQTSASVILSQPTQINGSASVNGYTVSVTASGGTGSLQYSIDGGSFQSSSSFTPIANGTHNIVVKDANGCEITLSATVSVATLAISGSITHPISCAGDSDGQITANGTGGVPAYQYSLNGGSYQSSSVFSNLAAGSYTLTIKDSGGFTVSSSTITVTAPASLSASATPAGSTVTVTASGGTAPYLYQLDGGASQSSSVFNGVANGTHTMTVTDAHGCTASTDVLVGGVPPNIFVSLAQPVSCHGEADASISATASGGNPPYQYSLNGGAFQSSPTFTGLAAGSYTVTVMGADGGTTTAPAIIVTEPTALGASATTFGLTITATAIGGTAPYQYSLDGSNFGNSNELEVTDNGSYTVTIQDSHGCTATASITVNAVVGLNLTVGNVTCFGDADGEVTIAGVTGGMPPYTYSFDGGAFSSQTTYAGLAAGSYSLQVMDETGYVFSAPDINILSPTDIQANFQLNLNNLTIVASGGTGAFMYSIDGGATFQTSNTFNDLPLGTYDVVIKDENGCTFEDQVIVDMSATGEQAGSLVFEVLPNPSNGLFILKMDLPSSAKLDLSVFDVVGRQVFASQMEAVGSVQQPLDLQGLASGTYLLRVTDGEQSGVKRLVIIN
jgi:subtilisin-like proprotein convertase family protein